MGTFSTRIGGILLASACTAIALPASAQQREGEDDARAYKYTGEDGTAVYGDYYPPEAAARSKAKLNEYGVVTEELPPQLTPEEIRERERRAAEEAARAEREAREREYVEKLFRSFAVEADLRRFHESQLNAIYLRIAENDRKLRRLREQLLAAEERASGYNYPYRPDSDRPDVPEELVARLLRITEAIAEREADGATRRRELQEQKARYEKDLAMYQEHLGMHASLARPRAEGEH